jgi:hypothetical protein
MKRKKATRWAFVALLIVIALMPATFSFAQDQPMGDIARQARAEKSTAPHATKTLTNDDFAPQPVSEKDDPMEVVARGARALATDTMHRCTSQVTNNSGPGSLAETLVEFAGPDSMHMVNRRTGNNPKLFEAIVLADFWYDRWDAGPWLKNVGRVHPDVLDAMHHVPEALTLGSGSKDLRLAGRDVVGGAPTFLYEMQFHPGQVPTRDTALKIWVGLNDGLPRRFQLRTADNTFTPPIVDDDITTCSYGNVPEIKAPI